MPRRVHCTERSTFRSCRRYWRYTCVEGLEPFRGNTNLQIGSAGHAILGKYYTHLWQSQQTSDPDRTSIGELMSVQEVLNHWDEEWLAVEQTTGEQKYPDLTLDDFELVKGMLKGYVLYSHKEDVNLEVLTYKGNPAVEVELVSSYLTAEGDVVVGTLDLIGQNRINGRRTVYDHKWYGNFVGDADLDTDDQSSTYLWLAHINGIKVDNFKLNQLRKKIPCEPQLLASGKALSKSKSIDTTYDKYLEAVLENGFDPDDYREFLESLSENAFFKRATTSRTISEFNSIERDLKNELADMTDPNLRIYPNWQYGCGWCSMKTLCLIEHEQGDVEAVKQSSFKRVELRK